MGNDRVHQASATTLYPINRRRANLRGLLLLVALSICGCQRATPSQDTTMSQDGKEIAYFSVSAISYIERPIFAVKLNGIEVGAGGGSVMSGVAVPLGPQSLTWRLDGPEGTPGNGDTVRATNQPVLARQDAKMKYLGVHIYPDNTIEVIPAPYWPEKTELGKKILREQETKHGQ